MANFELIQRGEYMFVQSINYNNPINDLNEISKKLACTNYEGEVVFDLLLTNGNSSGRFLISVFINRKFEMRSFKKTIISKNIRKEIIIYYKNNQNFLSNSILSRTIIDKILDEKLINE